MIYDNLAEYYDALVKDPEATEMWVEFTKKFINKPKILELACGSGEISFALSELGYDLLATDFSKAMIKELNQKYPEIKTKVLDMSNFSLTEKYDGCICYCDSINYLKNLSKVEEMIKSVHHCLNQDGIFIFDMHSIDRLDEFRNLYIEENILDDTPYQWTIQTQGDEIHQHFAFFKDDLVLEEQHVQKVFLSKDIEDMLTKYGFSYEIYTDFTLEGEQPGEKIFFVGRKIC